MNEALHMPYTLAGRYRLERELGHGAMGYVYLARDLKHGREVAVKVLAPQASQSLDAERFLAEVHTAAGLNHPHILTIHDSGEADGRLYYVMPRVEGSSLRDRLDRERRLPLAEAVEIARQAGEGLAYIHARGLVHRDIKPGNILIDATGHTYIADFGLALALSSVSSARRTATGIALGSPLYMSPEQAAGTADVDARSDVYALGCVLFEMLAGSPPFQAREVRQVLNLHLTAAPPALRSRRADVPLALERIVQRALEKDPDDRYATAKVFAETLEDAVLPLGGSARRARARAGASAASPDSGRGAAPASEVDWRPNTGRGMKVWLARLGQRDTLKWLLAYLVVGWLLLQGTQALVGAFSWPVAVVRGALLVFAAGALALAVLPWLTRRRARGGRGPRQTRWALTAVSAGALLAAGAIVASGWDGLPTWADGPLSQSSLVPSGAGIGSAAERGSGGALEPNRIAVLYFDDRSPDGDLDHLAAGFTESLIDALTAVPGLEVLSKHAVAPYRAQAVPLEEIVSTLEAGTLVSGTVRREEGLLQVSIQLVEGETGTQLWTTTFERPSGALLSVRDRLVEEVARALRTRLGYEFEVRRIRQDATSDVAWRLVREGDDLLARHSAALNDAEDREAAARFLRRADSMYADAAERDTAWLEPMLRRAEVAELESRLHRPSPDRQHPQHLERGIGFTNAVLDRDPDYAPAVEMRGRLRYYLAESMAGPESGQLLAAATDDLRRAVELQPSLAAGWWHLSRALGRQGRFTEAVAAAERAHTEDAFLEMPQGIMFQLFHLAHARERFEEAKQWCELGSQRHPSSQHFVLCRLYLLVSMENLRPDVDQAWTLADSVTLLADDGRRDDFRFLAQLQVAKIALRAGMSDSARAVVDRLEREHDGFPDFATYDAAHLKLLMDERDEALRLLRRWVDYRGPQTASSLATDWWFRPLRGDSGFDALTGRRSADQ